MTHTYIAIGGLIVMILLVSAIIIKGGTSRPASQQHISAPMGKGHANLTFHGRVVPELPPMIETVHAEIRQKGWIADTEHAEQERELEPFRRWIDEHNSDFD